MPLELPFQSGRQALATLLRSVSTLTTDRPPLREERLFPLALTFRQSCENLLRSSPLRRVGQIIRKTLLENLDNIGIRSCTFDLPRQVRPQLIDQSPLILGRERLHFRHFFEKHRAKIPSNRRMLKPETADTDSLNRRSQRPQREHILPAHYLLLPARPFAVSFPPPSLTKAAPYPQPQYYLSA
jgi:hypothetical protein